MNPLIQRKAATVGDIITERTSFQWYELVGFSFLQYVSRFLSCWFSSSCNKACPITCPYFFSSDCSSHCDFFYSMTAILSFWEVVLEKALMCLFSFFQEVIGDLDLNTANQTMTY